MDRVSKKHVRREVKRCAAGLEGFLYWAETYCRIEDKEAHQAIPLEMWPAQRELAAKLFAGEWLWILKARRVGFTWLLAAYSTWLVTFHAHRTIVVLCQDDDYSKDFLDRVRYVLDRLPVWMRRTATRDNTKRLDFNRDGHGSWIRAFAPTKRVGRSLAADLVVIDEGAYVPWLAQILHAAEPTLETGKGQLVSLSTSDGPLGLWSEVFKRSWRGETKYRALFYGWESHPGRDAEWYAAEAKAHEHDPLYMKRQYPRSWEESFEAAEGRIYALFTESAKFVRRIDVEPDWKKFRGIDFGGVDPFVCLWAAIIPHEADALTLDPSCTNTLAEFLSYSYGPNGEPEDEHNHAMDALRYMVTGFRLRGHIHIYRELYVADSARKGLTPADLGRRAIEMSGAEKFRGSCADASRPDSITTLCAEGLPCIPSPRLRGRNGGEIKQGLDQVRRLIKGAHDGNPDAEPPEPKRVCNRRIALEGDRALFLARLGRQGRAPRLIPMYG